MAAAYMPNEAKLTRRQVLGALDATRIAATGLNLAEPQNNTAGTNARHVPFRYSLQA